MRVSFDTYHYMDRGLDIALVMQSRYHRVQVRVALVSVNPLKWIFQWRKGGSFLDKIMHMGIYIENHRGCWAGGRWGCFGVYFGILDLVVSYSRL